MTQPGSTASTCAVRWKMWLLKVFSVISFTAVCAAQDTQDDKSSTPPVPTSMVTPAYVPDPPSLQLQSLWSDVFPSEKVEFRCGFSGSSDWTFTWYRNGAPLADSDPNVSLAAEGAILTLTAATQMYTGSYSCKGQHPTKKVTTEASNTLKLTVSANKPKPTLTRSPNYDKMYPGESITFTCTVDVSSGWEIMWYHNGSEIQGLNGATHTIASIGHPNSGEYYCKAKRGKDQFATNGSEKATLQVFDPPTPILIRLTPWSDVFEGETVTFMCVTESPDWTASWYRDQITLQEDSVVTMDAYDEEVLNITSTNSTHQGGYSCKVHLDNRGANSSGYSNVIHVTVYDKTPKPTLSKDPGFNPMYVGETLTLTCNVTVASDWQYNWYKDGKYLTATAETHHAIHLGPSDGGMYWCKANRALTTTTEISEKIPQGVLEIPAPSLTLATPWPDVFLTESVKLSCGINDSSAWTYTWYKDEREVQADSVVSINSNGATLSVSSASAIRAGQYKCMGRLKDRSVNSSYSPGLALTVYDETPTAVLVQDPHYQVMFPGEAVTFSCHINASSGWRFLWYKDGERFSSSGNTHSISSVASSNTGSYKCQAKRGRNPVFNSDQSQAIRLEVKATPVPSLTLATPWPDVFPTEGVKLSCGITDNSGWTYTWYKDGQPVQADSVVSIDSNGATLSISSASATHAGQYKCMGHLKDRSFNSSYSPGLVLTVYDEKPSVKLAQEPSYKVMFPEETVTFSCHIEVSSGWEYVWYKDGNLLPAFGNSHTITPVTSSDTGSYKCQAKRGKDTVLHSSESQAIHLEVKDKKPSVTLVQNLNHDVMHTGDSVSFSCHINISSGWEFLWSKDGSTLPESGSHHSIASVVRSDTGSYTCQAKRGKKAVFLSHQSHTVTLNIEERPQADIVLLTGWSEVFSTDTLVLRCGVQGSQDMWNYTWFKEDEELHVLSEKHSVTPQSDPEQSLYRCKGVRNGRPSYSKMSDSFKTKNLLLKRRVLLSISGCLFFGLIAVFLGCIILRVVRKPAVDDDKPEEANLFLTMAELKDRADAPSPLVDYITDEALNAPPKEGDENGTICSETTPLPITSQEDQAATTESHDTTENNGGLVSFKQ